MENITAKWFGKDISNLMLRRHMKCLDEAKLSFFANKMTVNLDMLTAFVVHRILSNMNCGLTITVKR
jgi:hypothetical protein